MESEKIGTDKIERVLGIYTKLINGSVVYKSEEAANYCVNERSIQRDIDDIRMFLDRKGTEDGIINTIVYDRMAKGYRLEKMYHQKLTNGEILAICKILLDSRAFLKSEMTEILDKLISSCVPDKNKKEVLDLIKNEEFHYVELQHKTRILDNLWRIGQTIRTSQCIEIDYERIKDGSVVRRKLQPVAIMFSEYYFYLTAFIDDEDVKKGFDVINDSFPTIYRIDRIKNLKILDEKYHIPYSDRFEEGEFRKRIQFMYGGKIQKVEFSYSGKDIDAILDRLPTAKILHEMGGVYTISAEVFGKGIDMWFRSQGDMVSEIKYR